MLGFVKTFVVFALFCIQPMVVWGESVSREDMESFYDMLKELNWDKSSDSKRVEIFNRVDKARESYDKSVLDEKTKAYEDAKANEQSLANRTLSATTMAATGLGAMELMQGLAEKNADEDAQKDMAAYISTMRCSYADGKSVKAGPDEIELPGGNDQTTMNLRGEYFALVESLKERKTALNLKPGIESEVILDKTQSGLYDDENVGIIDGSYESLYRAQMLNSEKDQSAIDAAADASQKRVLGGAIAAGAGVVIGVAGNALINGELGKKLKQAINEKKVGKETQKLLKKEAKALEDLQDCLKKGGAEKTDELNFEEFYPSVLAISITEKCTLKEGLTDKTAQNLFVDDTDATKIYDKLAESFDTDTLNKMIGVKKNDSKGTAIAHIKSEIESVQKKFKEAEEKDKEAAKKAGITLDDISGSADGDGMRARSSLFNNVDSGDKFQLLNFRN